MTEKERELIVEFMEILTRNLPGNLFFDLSDFNRMKAITEQLCAPRTPRIRTTGRPIDDGEV